MTEQNELEKYRRMREAAVSYIDEIQRELNDNPGEKPEDWLDIKRMMIENRQKCIRLIDNMYPELSAADGDTHPTQQEAEDSEQYQPENRVEYREDGTLDEVYADGGAFLEWMTDGIYFLNCYRKDGSSVALQIAGEVVDVEIREPYEGFSANSGNNNSD